MTIHPCYAPLAAPTRTSPRGFSSRRSPVTGVPRGRRLHHDLWGSRLDVTVRYRLLRVMVAGRVVDGPWLVRKSAVEGVDEVP